MFLTVCSLVACLLLPVDSSRDAVQGPELTNEENRDSLIRFENVRDHLRQRETYTLELQDLSSFSTSIQPKINNCSDETSATLNW